MEFFQTIWTAISTPNPELVEILSIPLGLLEIYLYMLLFNSILNLNGNKKQQLLYTFTFFILGKISILLFNNYGGIINVIIAPILIMIIFKTSMLKGFIANIFPLVIGALLSTLISKIYLIGFNITQDTLTYIPIFRITYTLLVYIFMFAFYLISKHLKFNIHLLDNMNKKNKNLLLINSILGLICLGIQYYLTIYYIDKLQFPIFVTILNNIGILAYFFINIYSLTRTEKLEIATQDLEESQLYNKTLKIMYDDIRGFRHDFNNIVQSIGGYVTTKDLEGLKNYYTGLLEDCQRVNNLAILSPDVINNPAIYSLLTSKYHKAKEFGIKINLEIFTDLSKIYMNIYEYTRILGILLDNAIEAASQCNEKVVNIEFRNDYRTNKQLAIIKNTYKDKDIDMSRIFEKGYSTKENKKDHGIGLWEVNQILRKNNNMVELLTNKNDEYFIQQLEIIIPNVNK